MKILITGGSGRLGAEVVGNLLHSNNKIISFDKNISDTYKFKQIQGDITNFQDIFNATKEIDCVIHLAALTSESPIAQNIFNVNILGTFNVLEASAQNRVKKIIYASSICTIGYGFQRNILYPEYLPLDEEHPTLAEDMYGASKVICEVMCQRYSRRHDMSIICLRFPLIAFDKNYPFYFSPEWELQNAKNLWTYVDGEDAAEGIKLALENKNIKFDVINIGAADHLSDKPLKELFKRYYPDYHNFSELDNLKNLFDISKAEKVLSYKPKHSFRSYL